MECLKVIWIRDFILQPDEVKGQDVHLSSLKECEVMLFGTPSTLLMTNINGCK